MQVFVRDDDDLQIWVSKDLTIITNPMKKQREKVAIWNFCESFFSPLNIFLITARKTREKRQKPISISHAKHYKERPWEWPYRILCKRRVARWRVNQVTRSHHSSMKRKKEKITKRHEVSRKKGVGRLVFWRSARLTSWRTSRLQTAPMGAEISFVLLAFQADTKKHIYSPKL